MVGRQGDRRLVRRFAEKEFASHKRQGQSRQRSSTHYEGKARGRRTAGVNRMKTGKEQGEEGVEILMRTRLRMERDAAE